MARHVRQAQTMPVMGVQDKVNVAKIREIKQMAVIAFKNGTFQFCLQLKDLKSEHRKQLGEDPAFLTFRPKKK
jgi:hypothetical protein